MLDLLKRLFKPPEPLIPEIPKLAWAGPVPKISPEEVKRWATNAASKGARYLVVVFEHNLYDDLRELYPWEAYTAQHLRHRLRLIDGGKDATAMQVIDLSLDIDGQLAQASYTT